MIKIQQVLSDHSRPDARTITITFSEDIDQNNIEIESVPVNSPTEEHALQLKNWKDKSVVTIFQNKLMITQYE